MSKAVNRILGTSSKLAEESEDYKPLVMTGGRPCMGFSIIQRGGNMSAFLYHSLDNLVTHPSIDGQELLAFTHRGTAVTIRGQNLRKVLRAIMSPAGNLGTGRAPTARGRRLPDRREDRRDALEHAAGASRVL